MNSVVLLFLTIFSFGVSVFFRKLAVDRIHPYQIQVVAGIVYMLELPVWAYLIQREKIVGYDPLGVTYAVACLITYVVAAVLFGTLLRGTNDAGMIATYVAMNPVVTMALSVSFLGEQLSLRKVAATAVMLFGFYLFNR